MSSLTCVRRGMGYPAGNVFVALAAIGPILRRFQHGGKPKRRRRHLRRRGRGPALLWSCHGSRCGDISVQDKVKHGALGEFGSTHSRPSCASMIERQIDGPIPMPSEAMARIYGKDIVADQFVETLAAAGVKRIYGIVGDSLNGPTDAVCRQGKVDWLHMRHEEVAGSSARRLNVGIQTVEIAPSRRRRSFLRTPRSPWRYRRKKF
jgi:hypothetical protein